MTLRKITFDINLFLGKGDTKRSRKALLWLLQGLVGINRTWFEQYPATPHLYDTEVVYRPERSSEVWFDIPSILKRGHGDCEDLACWRVAELNTWGIRARPYIKWRKMPSGRMVYHAAVLRPDGKIEDPSRALGMGGHPLTRQPVFISL